MANAELEIQATMAQLKTRFGGLFPVVNRQALRNSPQLPQILQELSFRYPSACLPVKATGLSDWQYLTQVVPGASDAVQDQFSKKEFHWEPVIRQLHNKNEQAEQNTRDANQVLLEQRKQVRNESYRVLVLVSGIIIGLLIPLIIEGAGNLDSVVARSLAISTTILFATTVLHIIFVTLPLISSYGGAQNSIEKPRGFVKLLFHLGTVRIWQKWVIPRPNDDISNINYDRLKYFALTGHDAGRGVLTGAEYDMSRLAGFARVWFLLGILTSIALVIYVVLTPETQSMQ